MKYVLIAPCGDDLGPLFIGLREFPTEKIYLLCPEGREAAAEKAKKELDRFKIPVYVKILKGNVWEATFKAVAEIKNIEKDKELIVNVSAGDAHSCRCAACSASFVNGLRAFEIENNELQLLPILKFSYYKVIQDKKMDILSVLFKDRTCCASLEELSKKTKMSLPLISYHINGNLKSEGLKQLGLVETKEEKGRVSVTLTTMGRLLVKGYVK
ncbi:MAG TPA: winged helix-turn-helix domain-containing protein [Candidatus Nanoarchaeia archaeon]|nr:winged helix-turn-helix domain-containing protein [Candidatus Nanoarchaeia archaeon]